MSEIDQVEMARIIDEAVSCWHEVADDHGIKHCHCFREMFAQRMIDLGLFIGYDKLYPPPPKGVIHTVLFEGKEIEATIYPDQNH